jgi:hypothetical protein
VSDIYKPESIDDLRQQSSTVLQNAYNSGYIVGVEQGERLAEERIIKLLDDKCERPLDPEWEHHWEDGCRCALVALIEGENNA